MSIGKIAGMAPGALGTVIGAGSEMYKSGMINAGLNHTSEVVGYSLEELAQRSTLIASVQKKNTPFQTIGLDMGTDALAAFALGPVGWAGMAAGKAALSATDMFKAEQTDEAKLAAMYALLTGKGPVSPDDLLEAVQAGASKHDATMIQHHKGKDPASKALDHYVEIYIDPLLGAETAPEGMSKIQFLAQKINNAGEVSRADVVAMLVMDKLPIEKRVVSKNAVDAESGESMGDETPGSDNGEGPTEAGNPEIMDEVRTGSCELPSGFDKQNCNVDPSNYVTPTSVPAGVAAKTNPGATGKGKPQKVRR